MSTTNYTGTWDPTELYESEFASLSNGNTVFTVSLPGTSIRGAIRSTPSFTLGATPVLLWFTPQIVAGSSTQVIGICNGTYNVEFGIPGTDSNSIGFFVPGSSADGAILLNDAAIGTAAEAIQGNVCVLALTSTLLWLSTDGGVTWNAGTGSGGSPYTLTGGYSISGLVAGPYFAAATISSTTGATNALLITTQPSPPTPTPPVSNMTQNTGTTQLIIPAYAYEQYRDDDNIVALFEAYNQIAQSYLNWFNQTQLGVYTQLFGPLLDWIAEGLYGIARPALPSGLVQSVGPLNTWAPNTANIGLNTSITLGVINNYVVTDDIFKRIITWFFFKGDGQQFTTNWLKRRVMRFLTGSSGTAPNIDNTYPVSVTHGVDYEVTITITLTTAYGIALLNAQLFQAGIASGVLQTPFQYSFTVVIVNDLTATNLTNVSGILHITSATGWSTSSSGLADGAVWANGGSGGVVTVVPGVTPNPFAAPQIFGVTTSATLLAIGGGNLPLSDPHVVGQIWNNSNVATVSAG